ncbi:MAG: FliM/FliN family flagellar motor switch protein [Rhodobacteraceae bacterium]|nr:FliM/FliN family flagellar motor switch protein [Paracoccaceae bacterium]
MTDTAPETVLMRKLAAGRSLGAAARVTPARAFGQAAAKAGQELYGLPVSVGAATELRASLADLPERLPDRALLVLVAGPGGGMGVMALSPEVLAGLIEVQTTGALGKGDVAPRRPTRTDAALAQRFIAEVLDRFGAALAGDPASVWAGGFAYGSFLEDARPIALILEETGYRFLTATLALGAEGAREGQILLALPAEGRGSPPAPAPEAEGERSAAAADWADRIEDRVMGAEAVLDAVLGRLTLPLSDLMALQPGAVLHLPRAQVVSVRLEAEGRRAVATGRLGQWQGHLALRLNGPSEDGPAPGGAALGTAEALSRLGSAAAPKPETGASADRAPAAP